MNIFVTEPCPIASAEALDDKRVVKMILESAQLLSTAIHINVLTLDDDISQVLYKPTHKQHPCALWSAHSNSNWEWLFQHFLALCQEYTHRYGKYHKSAALAPHLRKYHYLIKDGPQTSFANCTRFEHCDFRHLQDVHDAYKRYLTIKWNNDKLIPKWTNRAQPSWYTRTEG